MSGYKSPSLIPHKSTRRAVSSVVKSLNPISKTMVLPLEFRFYREYKLRYASYATDSHATVQKYMYMLGAQLITQ